MSKVSTHYGHFSGRVSRLTNEDEYSAATLDMDFSQNKKVTKVFNFNVFDGHGGNDCSQYLKTHLSSNIESLLMDTSSVDKLLKSYVERIGGYWARWYRRNRDHIIDSLIPDRTMPFYEDKLFRLRLLVGFLDTDMKFLEQEGNFSDPPTAEVHSGSTCTSVFLCPLDPSGQFKPQTSGDSLYYGENTLSKLTVAHVGDSKAILCDAQGVAHALTTDHHPSNPLEVMRLSKFQTDFLMVDSFGEERFINFANTRAFGDYPGKDKGISAEPEIHELLIGSPSLIKQYLQVSRNNALRHFGGDESFIVLVSDGVTNFLTDQEIVDIITVTVNNRGTWKGTPQLAASQVVKFVECIGGNDNATVSIIRLSGWAKWPTLDRTGRLREDKMMTNMRRDKR